MPGTALATWPPRGRQLERVGTHPLRFVARKEEDQVCTSGEFLVY